MGFWDVRLADLGAAGESFTEDEVRVLEGGGRVLHLHPLETPDVEVRDWCTYPDGEVVVLPEVLEVHGPSDLMLPGYYPATEKGKPVPPMTVAEYLDKEYSWHGGRKDWTDLPRYAGDVASLHDIHSVRCEEFTAYVYWNCYPLVTKHDEALAEQILAAATEFLDTALWWPVEMMCRAWYDGEYDPVDLWAVVHHPEVIEPEDRDSLIELLEYTYGSYAEEEAKFQAQAVQDLLDARIIDLTGHLAPFAHGEELRIMPWPRMEDILDARKQYDAADLWRRIHARREAAIRRNASPINHRGYTENEVLD